MDRRKRRRLLSALQSGILEEIRSISNTALASFTGDGRDLVRLVVGINPGQSGSGDPTPDNVRPITGWTEAKIFQTGKNLLFMTDGTYTINDVNIVVSNGVITASGTATANGGRTTPISPIFVLKAGTYFISDDYSGVQFTPYINRYSNNTTVNTGKNRNFTLSEDTAVYFGINVQGGTTYNDTVHVMLNTGNTAETWERPSSLSYTIDLDGTCYGGTLDVTVGKLTVDRAIVDLGTLNWAKGSIDAAGAVYHNRWYNKTVSNMGGAVDTANGICSHYTVVPYTGASSDVNVLLNGKRDNVASSEYRGYIQIVDSAKDNLTAEEFKAAMSGVMFVYVLSTTIEVQLTPTQIATLSGVTNNIWADTGDIILLEYMA